MTLRAPNRVFDRISDIDIAHDLLGCGLTCALLDVDNTIRSRADGQVPPDVRAWLDRAQQAGVRLCILSNNWHENIPQLAAELNLPYVYKAAKPLPFGYLAALRMMACPCERAVMIGDQLYTDIAGARAVGMKAYLVGPLSAADLWYTKVLRRVFRPASSAKPERSRAPEPEPAPAFSQELDSARTVGERTVECAGDAELPR